MRKYKLLWIICLGLCHAASEAQDATFNNLTINTLTKGEGAYAYSGWGLNHQKTADVRPNWDNGVAFVMNHHFGLTFSAHSYYGGIRFYNQGYPGTFDPATGAQMVMSITNGRVGIGTANPDQRLTIKGGGIGFDGNSGDKKLYSSNDGLLEWMTHDEAAEPAFVISHQGQKRVYLSTRSGSYLMGSNLGIGSATPISKLHVNTTTANDGLAITHNYGEGFVRLHSTSLGSNAWNGITRSGDAGLVFGNQTAGGFNFGFVIAPWRNDVSGLRMDNSGSVSIGTYLSDPSSKLLVEGTIRSRKVRVDQSSWPDYVFQHGYRLPSLAEVEEYIKRHKHLPDVPSVKEVEKNGLDVGENQAILLKKIEELTLYMIELKKQVEGQQSEIRVLKKKAKR